MEVDILAIEAEPKTLADLAGWNLTVYGCIVLTDGRDSLLAELSQFCHENAIPVSYSVPLSTCLSSNLHLSV